MLQFVLLAAISFGFSSALPTTTANAYTPDHTTACPTVCADAVNECGMWYGGCYPKCPGAPAKVFTPPPCPPTKPVKPACINICEDAVNECGMWYGGCYPDPVCAGVPKPVFTAPACPPTKPPTKPTKPTKPYKPTKPTKPECFNICEDAVNECGMMYGGCYPDPKCAGVPKPVFTPPPCPTKPPVKPESCTQSICYDGIDECGQGFGGCTLAPQCGGPVSPTFSRPSCSLTTPPYGVKTTPCTTTTRYPKITNKPKVTPKPKHYKPAAKTTSCSSTIKPKTKQVYYPKATPAPTRRY